ncbi:MAG TPA: alpha/beta hydrolase [Dehalococcoidia bacterium]|nr:alpha/beta hydrolase [Dehalococcoidia bacterium]
MPEVQVNGIALHYEEAGSGEPLLLLHGGAGTALLHFRREITELGERFHVVAPDMRGYGHSTPPRLFEGDFYGQDGLDLAALIEALGLAPAHLCGWSDGSIAALIVAADRPELVRTLSVWGAEGRILPQERALWRNITNWQGWPEHVRERVAQAQGPLNWPGLFDRMLVGYNRVLDAGGMIVANRLDRVRAPTLIMHGDEDDVVPVQHAYELNRLIAGSELRIFHGAGHALHRERHAELMEMLTAFIERQRETEAGEAGDRSAVSGG